MENPDRNNFLSRQFLMGFRRPYTPSSADPKIKQRPARRGDSHETGFLGDCAALQQLVRDLGRFTLSK
jgi:hypothetical protein